MTSPRLTSRLALAGAFACASLALVACGGDDEETTTQAATTTTTTGGATGATGVEGADNAHINAATGDAAGRLPDNREGTEPPPVAERELEAAAQAAGCELDLGLPDEGQQHLAPGEPKPRYDTNPATSGRHAPAPAADGAYLDTPPPTGVVHSLEHGRVAIQYNPDLPERDQLLLKGVFDEDFEGVLLFPNPEMPYEVAVTAWTNLAGCDSFDESVLDVVRDFRDEFRGKGPERVPFKF